MKFKFLYLIIGSVFLAFVFQSIYLEILRDAELIITKISDHRYTNWVNFSTMFIASVIIFKWRIFGLKNIVGVFIFIVAIYLGSYFIHDPAYMLDFAIKNNAFALVSVGMLIVVSEVIRHYKNRIDDAEIMDE